MRHLIRLPGVFQNSAYAGPNCWGARNMRSPGPAANRIGASGNRGVPWRTSETVTWLVAVRMRHLFVALRGFRSSEKHGANFRAEMKHATAGPAINPVGSPGCHRVPVERQKPFRGPIAAGFRQWVGFLRIWRGSEKPPPTWRGCVEYATPRVRGQPNRVRMKARNSASGPRRGGFAPFTRIPQELPAFYENGA